MSVSGSRVGVVGGSIAGCATAIALRRAGCEVTVFERSRGGLADRGFGIALPVPLRERLVADGYLDAALPGCVRSEGYWTVRDGDARAGRTILRQRFTAVYNNWGVLWRALLDQVPAGAYRRAAVTAVDDEGDGVVVTTAAGDRHRFDVVIGADGYRSVVRERVATGLHPRYAGYVLWRGNYPAERLPADPPFDLEECSIVVGYPGGHGGFYLIPDLVPDLCRLNWAIYSSPPPAVPGGPAEVPSGRVDDATRAHLDEILTTHFPPYWVDTVRRTRRDELFLQPIYDLPLPRYATDRLALVGDAGTVVRPHTGAGASKALQDGLALEHACRQHDTWAGVLAAYDRERVDAGNVLVAEGQRLGRDRVERTPPWTTMNDADLLRWLSGNSLYGPPPRR